MPVYWSRSIVDKDKELSKHCKRNRHTTLEKRQTEIISSLYLSNLFSSNSCLP